MSVKEQLAEITRMEEQAAELGLADQLKENFAIMRREAVATGSGWDKQNEELEGQLAEKDQRSQASKKDLKKREEKAQEQLDEIANMEAQAKELGIYDKLEENFAIMRREAVDDLEVSSEILGFINSAREGASFGILGDEARAAGRLAPYLMLSAYTKTLPTDLLGEKYTEFVADERAREKEFVDDNGVADFVARFGGGLASGSALSRAFGVGQSAKEGALRQGGAAGIEGFLYGFSEGDGDFERRLVDGLKLGGGTALLGSGFGAIAGRAEGNIAKNEAKRQELLKIRQKKVAELNKPTSDSDEVIDQATRYLSEVAEDYTRQTGKPLTGADYGIALRQMQQETGLSTKRLRHAEMETGRELIDFRKTTLEELRAKNSKLADEVGFTGDGYNPSKLKKWVTKAIRPLAKHGEQWVSKAFGGAIQRTAGNIVQRQYFAEQAMKTQPIMNFQKVSAQDGEIQRRILNMSNIKKKNPNKNFDERKEQHDALVAYIRREYGDQADDLLDGMRQIQAQLQRANAELRRSVDGDIPQDPYYWPSVFKKENPYASERSPSSRQSFTSEYEQERNILEVGDSLLPSYEEPVIAAMSHIRKAIAQTEAFDQMRLKNYAATRAELRAATQQGTKKQRNEAKRKLDTFENQIRTGQRLQIEMQNALKEQGAGVVARDAAGDTLNTLIVYGQRGPDAWLSNLRKAAYMGTIGNPYSAVLNLGDIANSFVNFGAENTVAALKDMFARRGVTMTVKEVGLANQSTGEFLQENYGRWTQRFSTMSEQVFKRSGFRAVDQFGKNVAINAALKKGKELIRNGRLDDEWGFAFTPNEMARLKRDLMRGPTKKVGKDGKVTYEHSDIVKEFAAANIARLQPSNMAQMPKWYLEHPNWRVLWMLKTFAMKQIDQLERLVVQEWKNGNKKDAVKNALAYMFVVGGTNATLMEGRQALKGDVPDPANFAMRYGDWALGVASVNLMSSYQIQKARQDGAAALVPTITPISEMLMAPVADVMTYAGDPDKMDEFLEDSETLGWLPFGRLAQSWIEDD